MCEDELVPDNAIGVRQARRDDVAAQILQVGRLHLVKDGAAALSLRAVARDLGMVSSAVYRYVANRDDLLTLLLVDAYDELADDVDTAVAGAAEQPWSARVLVAARALRGWAIREPARYALLYGSPVPGYAAPPERTVEPGTRVIRTMVQLVSEGNAAGDVVGSAALVPLPAPLRRNLCAIARDLNTDLDPDHLARTTLLWSTLIGSVSLEVFGQYGQDTFAEPGLLFEYQMASALATLTGTGIVPRG